MVALATAHITPIWTREARVGMFEWIGEIAGQVKVPVFTCPDVFVAMCDGDTICAIFLAQVHFLQQQSMHSGGWVVESSKYWTKRLGISPYQLRCYAKSLQPFGLKAEKRGVHPSITWHFQIDDEKLRQAVKSYYTDGLTMKNFTVEEHAPANDEKVADQPSNITPLTMKNSIINDEKIDGSIEREDQETRKNDQEGSDALASGGAAIAVAPVAVVPSRRQRKTTKMETPPDGKARASPSGSDAPLNDYRAACWKLLRDKYGQDVAKEGREIAAMKRLFEKKIPLEDVEGCWHATLIDPRWDTDPLTLAIVEEKLAVYRRNPDGYKAGMLKKRRDQLDREKMQAEREKRGSTNGQNPAISRARPPGAVAFSDAERDAERARRAAVGE